jgi:hypothetical protein
MEIDDDLPVSDGVLVDEVRSCKMEGWMELKAPDGSGPRLSLLQVRRVRDGDPVCWV